MTIARNTQIAAVISEHTSPAIAIPVPVQPGFEPCDIPIALKTIPMIARSGPSSQAQKSSRLRIPSTMPATAMPLVCCRSIGGP